MKKSLVFLSAVAITCAATAGTVTWQCYDIKIGSTFLDGGKAYLFVGGSTDGVESAIKDQTFNFGAAISEATTDDSGSISVKGIGSYSNTDVSLYMVVFDTATVTDTSKFAVSDVVTQTFGTSGNKTYKFTDSIAAATWTPVKDSPGPIPEPTTAVLFALGLAAVGLKRKVA